MHYDCVTDGRTPWRVATARCGAYDTEGNRTSGPPVRGLDRYEYELRNGRVFLIGAYSVGHVKGEGKNAVITKYRLMNPGLHVDGPEQILYPIGPPR